MQYSALTLLALAATAFAGKNDTAPASTTTITVDSYTTVCPASSSVVIGKSTYVNTETKETTITASCPCTIEKPVYVTSSVYCSTCSAPTSSPAPVYPVNSTAAAGGVAKPTAAGSTPEGKPSSSSTSSGLATAGAGKTVVVSGASLAGLLGLAAYLL